MIAQSLLSNKYRPILRHLLYKGDPLTVAFTATSGSTVSIKAGTIVATPNNVVSVAVDTAVTMPSLVAGTDYAIYCCDDGSFRADASFTAPSGYTIANSRKIGGFHFAPGGNATARAGGDTTPAINPYSLWDVMFRPDCPDPRGKALVAGKFWTDIYLTALDHITHGSSKYNVSYADGDSPPKIPLAFGGNGSTAYGEYNWWDANEVATSFGMRLPTNIEFCALAYGTTEASSVGSAQNSTVLNAAYTSKWGVIQASGVLNVWGCNRGGPYADSAWHSTGRGSECNEPSAARFGGDWNYGSISGSRCLNWSGAASISSSSVGSRLVCDHLRLE